MAAFVSFWLLSALGGSCQFLAVLGIFSKLCVGKESMPKVLREGCAERRCRQLSADCVANNVVACGFNGLQIGRQKCIENKTNIL